MLQEKKSKRGAWIALGCVAALLVLVIVLENTMQPTSMLFTVLKKGAVYALVAASLNLLNGFTGLFSLGQAGFMLLGAYTYAILTIPSADRESVYYLYGGSAVNFSLPELFGGGALGLILGVLAALILAGCVAAVIAWLIGLPVLRLKSDYLAIATLGFAEIIRAIRYRSLSRPDSLPEEEAPVEMPMACSVALPAMPSAVRPLRRWKYLTASVVALP